MFSLVSPDGIDSIDVIVRNYGRIGSVVLGNETVVVTDSDVRSSGGSSGSKKQNGDIRIDWRFEIGGV